MACDVSPVAMFSSSNDTQCGVEPTGRIWKGCSIVEDDDHYQVNLFFFFFQVYKTSYEKQMLKGHKDSTITFWRCFLNDLCQCYFHCLCHWLFGRVNSDLHCPFVSQFPLWVCSLKGLYHCIVSSSLWLMSQRSVTTPLIDLSLSQLKTRHSKLCEFCIFILFSFAEDETFPFLGKWRKGRMSRLWRRTAGMWR